MSKLKFVINEEEREVSFVLWAALEGPKPEEGFECNGCSFSPDFYKEYKIWPACVIHDYHYGETLLGDSVGGRWHADKIFKRNIYRLLRLQGVGKIKSYRVSYVYYMGVRLGGSKAYGLKKPLPLMSRVKEFLK